MVAARQMMMSGGVPTARDYVQDGLVAMWDGIENAGWGTHDTTATTWKDLIGSNDLTLSNGGTFEEKCLFFDKTDLLSQVISLSPTTISTAKPFTIEFVYSHDGSTSINFGYYCFGTSYCGWIVQNDNRFRACGNSNTAPSYSELTYSEPHHVAGSYDGTNALTYIDGIYKYSEVPSSTNANSRPQLILNSSYGRVQNKTTRAYALRVYYQYTLTAAEVAANYAIDKARFNLP